MSTKPITSFFKPVQKKRGMQDQSDKENVKKVKSLNFPDDWATALTPELKKPYFAKLMELVDNDPGPVYPPIEDRYTFMKCPIDKIKCVIIGQDPYHGKNQAHGLCFSVRKGVRIPPSLQNIYTELSNDIEGFVSPKHGCLENWVDEGVLLLNASLSVHEGQPNSHAGFGWAQFTDAIISYINQKCDGVVFLLWGGFAQKKGQKIDSKRHLVLKATHPSPLGANKGGWFGCKHFSKTNEYLEKNGKEPINWANL